MNKQFIEDFYKLFNFNDHSSDNNPFKNLAGKLTSINPYEFAALSAIIGLLISSGLTVPEQNSIGNWFEALGQIILTINAQASLINQNQSNERISNLENEINILKEFLLKKS